MPNDDPFPESDFPFPEPDFPNDNPFNYDVAWACEGVSPSESEALLKLAQGHAMNASRAMVVKLTPVSKSTPTLPAHPALATAIDALRYEDWNFELGLMQNSPAVYAVWDAEARVSSAHLQVHDPKNPPRPALLIKPVENSEWHSVAYIDAQNQLT